MTASQFMLSGSTSKKLPSDALTISGVDVTCKREPCTPPMSTISYPRSLSGADPITFLSADAGSGMGSFTASVRVEVRVPANAYAGTYTTTIHVTIANGP